MTESRTVRDRLRAEYFESLPQLQRTLMALESEVRHLLLPVMLDLNRYEQVRVVSRIKECESAIDALRRRQEARVFDPEKSHDYTLTSLRDLVGIRVLVFPTIRIGAVRSALEPLLRKWSEDPIGGFQPTDPPIALKYYGRSKVAGSSVMSEVQIVSSLVGAFWDVEHAAVYKASPNLQGVLASPTMKDRYRAVLTVLRDFESEFERLVQEAADIPAASVEPPD
jgi:hypothetical protein